MSNSKLDLAAYPTEYSLFLKAGALKEVKVLMDTKSHAYTMRASINNYRQALRVARHPDYPACAKVTVTIVGEDKEGNRVPETQINPEVHAIYLIARPRGYDILAAFHAAGFKPDTLDEDPLDSLMAPFGLRDLSEQAPRK